MAKKTDTITLAPGDTKVVMSVIVPPNKSYLINDISIVPSALCDISGKIYINKKQYDSGIVNADGRILFTGGMVLSRLTRLDVSVTNNSDQSVTVDCVINYSTNTFSSANERKSIRKMVS